MAVACKRPRKTVLYRVYWAITFGLPPFLGHFSRLGMTMVKRFIIIDAVIYGYAEGKRDMLAKAPPEKRFVRAISYPRHSRGFILG